MCTTSQRLSNVHQHSQHTSHMHGFVPSSSYSEGSACTDVPAAPMGREPSTVSCISSPTHIRSRRMMALWTAECTRKCSSRQETSWMMVLRASPCAPNGLSLSLSRTISPNTSLSREKRAFSVYGYIGSWDMMYTPFLSRYSRQLPVILRG